MEEVDNRIEARREERERERERNDKHGMVGGCKGIDRGYAWTEKANLASPYEYGYRAGWTELGREK